MVLIFPPSTSHHQPSTNIWATVHILSSLRLVVYIQLHRAQLPPGSNTHFRNTNQGLTQEIHHTLECQVAMGHMAPPQLVITPVLLQMQETRQLMRILLGPSSTKVMYTLAGSRLAFMYLFYFFPLIIISCYIFKLLRVIF